MSAENAGNVVKTDHFAFHEPLSAIGRYGMPGIQVTQFPIYRNSTMRCMLLVCICCMGSCGCVVEQLRNDQDKIRLTLLDLYTDELMDNLVRARNGLPIIHLDYGTAQATITAKDSAMVSDSYAHTAMRVITTAAATTIATTKTAMNTLMGSTSHDNQEVVAVTATPLTTSVEAYNAYLQFLAVRGSLQCGSAPPPPAAAHICRKYDKVYYWIPIEFKDLFYNLALATTADRGRLLIPPPEFFAVTVTGATANPHGAVDLQIDSEIPNADYGTITFSGGKVGILSAYDPGDGTQLFQTKVLTSTFNDGFPMGFKSVAEFDAALKHNPLQVEVRLRGYQPPPPTTSQLLDQIPFDTPQVKADTPPPKAPPATASFEPVMDQ
jgi:hypothetical protein